MYAGTRSVFFQAPTHTLAHTHTHTHTRKNPPTNPACLTPEGTGGQTIARGVSLSARSTRRSSSLGLVLLTSYRIYCGSPLVSTWGHSLPWLQLGRASSDSAEKGALLAFVPSSSVPLSMMCCEGAARSGMWPGVKVLTRARPP